VSRFFMALALGVLVGVANLAAEDTIQGVTVTGSNSLHYDEGPEVDIRQPNAVYPDNTITRHYFEDRLQLDVYRGNIRVGARFLYFRPSAEDNYKDGLVDDNRIDKRYLEATLDPFKIRAGNFSDVWGHGLAFSAFEDRDIYFDSELDGAHVELNAEPFYVTVLRGTSEPGRLVQKAEVTAARINPRFGPQSVAFNYVFIDSGAYPETHIASVDWRLSYDPVTFYGERAWNRTLPTVTADNTGHATYMGSVVNVSGWALLLEYKDYDYKTVTPFQNPAVVYRELGPRLLESRDPHVLNVADEVGYQAELSGKVTSTTYTTLHYNASSRHDSTSKTIPIPSLKQANAPYWEMFASVEQDLPASRKFSVELGANEEAAAVWEKRQWASLTFTTPLKGTQQIELESQTMRVLDQVHTDRKVMDQLFLVAWDNGKGFSLSLEDQFTNDKQLEQIEGKNWPAAEAALVLSGGKNRVSVFYGRDRGGLRCSNGVCRQVQAFKGVRVTLETTF
jgi:hypothetical protein